MNRPVSRLKKRPVYYPEAEDTVERVETILRNAIAAALKHGVDVDKIVKEATIKDVIE